MGEQVDITIRTINQSSDVLADIGDSFVGLADAAENGLTGIPDMLAGIGEGFAEVANVAANELARVPDALSGIGEGFAEVTDGADAAANELGRVPTILSGVEDSFANVIRVADVATGELGNVPDMLADIGKGFANVGDTATSELAPVPNLLTNIRTALGDAANEALHGVAPAMQRAEQVAAESFASMLGASREFNQGFMTAGQVVAGTFSTLKGNYRGFGQVLGALAGPLGMVGQAVGNTLSDMVQGTIDQAEAFRKLSVATGGSVEFLSAFTQAADDERVTIEAVNDGLEKFGRLLGGVADETDAAQLGGKKFDQILKDINVDTKNADGTARRYEDVLMDVTDVFGDLGPGAKASALAVQLFGKRGTELLPILIKGRDGLKAMMEAAKDAGLVISDQMVEQVIRLKDAQDTFNDNIDALGMKISGVLIPALANATGGFNLYLAEVDRINNTEYASGFERGFASIANGVNFVLGRLEESTDAQGENADATARLAELADIGAAAQANYSADIDLVRNAIASTNVSFEAYMQQLKGSDLAAKTAKVTFQEYSEASQVLVTRQQELAKATKDAGQSQLDMVEKMGIVTGAIDDNFGKLSKLEEAQTAFKLATGQISVGQFETEMATKALTKAYIDGKLSLDEYVQSAKDLATGNAAEPFFAITEAGGQTNAAVLGVVKQIRAVEEAAGVGGGSVLSYADRLDIVTRSYQRAAVGAVSYEQALTDYNLAQLKNNDTLSESRKSYQDSVITQAEFAAAQAKSTIASEQARSALDAAKKAADTAHPAYVTYSKIVGDTNLAVGTLSTNIHNIPDAMDLATPRVTALGDALNTLGSTDIANVDDLLTNGLVDPMKLAAQAQAGSLVQIGTDLSRGVADGITASKAVSEGMKNSIDTAIKETRKAFEIESPSGVTRRDIGIPLAEGAALGVISAIGSVKTALEGGLMQSIVSTAEWVIPWARTIGVSVIDGILAGMRSRAEGEGATGTGKADSPSGINAIGGASVAASDNRPVQIIIRIGEESVYDRMYARIGDMLNREFAGEYGNS